ncbi:hypothetical protein DLJ53_15730 [Acuticoccus sediminis]|uniref:Uncharacterized protein n=2 Tax=Acuticoccus sediminis TaxID=2184697 RepID=A0A8B2NY39_9HYPH|nr:hypothetical protein DLJ53_15730 [Acuticoccus sediminis]
MADAGPGRAALDRLTGPLENVAALLCFVAGDGWDEARADVIVRLHQVGNRRDVADAIRTAERTVRAEIDAATAIDHLADKLRRRLDGAERACITDMVSKVAYAGSNSSTRASRAVARLLKG